MPRAKVMLTRAEYARRRRVSRAAVTKAIREGRIKVTNGRINASEADRIWAETTDPAAPSNSVSGNPPGAGQRYGDPEVPDDDAPADVTRAHAIYVRARAARTAYAARREKMALDRDAGTIVDAREVKEEIVRRHRRIRDLLLAAPDRLASPVHAAKSTRECREIVIREMKLICEELSLGGDPAGARKRVRPKTKAGTRRGRNGR